VLKIIEASVGDIEYLCSLYESMQQFYSADYVPPEKSKLKLECALTSISGGFVLIAMRAEKPIGFATVAPLFPASNLEITWYLKDLYAVPEARGSGIGKALMREVGKKVIEKGGTRLDFTTDTENSEAQTFYKQMGAVEIDKVYYRYDGDSLTNLAQG